MDFNDINIELGKLYEVIITDKENLGILIKGDTINVDILGSQSKPLTLSDLIDLTESGAVVEEGAYAFTSLPLYLYLSGSADQVEAVGFTIKEVTVTLS